MGLGASTTGGGADDGAGGGAALRGIQREGFRYFGPSSPRPRRPQLFSAIAAEARAPVHAAPRRTAAPQPAEGPSGGDRRDRNSTGPGPEEEELIVDPRRPAVHNCVVFMPVYPKSQLLDVLCALLPRHDSRLRELCSLAYMPRSVTVVQFVEQLALCLQDVDQEAELLNECNAVVFWLDIQDKLQEISLKRLVPKRYLSLPFDLPRGPKSNVHDDWPTEDDEDVAQEKEARNDAEDPAQGDEERAAASGDLQADASNPNPFDLRLEIPKDGFGPS